MKILFLYKKWLNDTDSLKEKTLSSKIKTKKILSLQMPCVLPQQNRVVEQQEKRTIRQ